VFLLVPAYAGSPGPKAVKQLCVCVTVCVCVEYLNMFCYKFTTESVSERIFENQFTFGEVMGKSLVSCVC